MPGALQLHRRQRLVHMDVITEHGDGGVGGGHAEAPAQPAQVADLGGLKLVGFPAWWMWKTVYMLKLPTLAARLRVVLDWTVELFFERDVSELSVEEDAA